MDPTLQDLLARLDRISGQLQELREGVKQAITIADLDPEMALTRARKVLEFVVRDIFQRRVGEEPGTRPLENLLQRLSKDGHLPKRLAAYANAVRELGNVGTHAFGESVTKADVSQSLAQLTLILEWYFEHERPPPPAQPVEPAPRTEPVPPPVPPPPPPVRPRAAPWRRWAVAAVVVVALACAGGVVIRILKTGESGRPPEPDGNPHPAGVAVGPAPNAPPSVKSVPSAPEQKAAEVKGPLPTVGGRLPTVGGQLPTVRPGPPTGTADQVLSGYTAAVVAVALSPDAQRAFSLGLDGTFRTWDVAKGEQQGLINLPVRGEWLHTRAAISADGRRVLVAAQDKNLRLFDGEKGDLVVDMSSVAGPVNCLALSADGTTALTGGADGGARLWELPVGIVRWSLTEKSSGVRAVALSPDGGWALIAGSGLPDERVRLVDLKAGPGSSPGRSLGHYDSFASAAAVAPDGRRALCAEMNGPIHSWDAATGSERLLTGAKGMVRCLTFTPDGRRALSGDDDTVRLWDVGAGRVVREFPGHGGYVLAVAVSADGRWVASAGLDRAVRVWRLPG
jgi:hypothetical protein